MEIKGVDLSYCQKGINYNKLKAAGVKFALIRAGFSETEDNLFAAHVSGCQSVGIAVGYYWYSYAKTTAQARKEAAACLRTIKRYPAPQYPIFFDGEEDEIAEANGREIMTYVALAFCEEIEKSGYPCGIYANPSWLETYYNKSRILGKYDIWLAHWTRNPARKSRLNYGQKIWQWGVGKIGNMDVDGDLCFVDYPKQTAEWFKKHNTGSAVSQPTTPNVGFKVGDIVNFTGTTHYASSTGTRGTAAKPGRAKITVIAAGAAHPYHLIAESGSASTVYGWVNAADINSTTSTAARIKVGSTVMLRNGAKDYNGGRLASFVYTRPHIVSEIKGDRAVITYGGAVVAAVKASDLTLA